MVKWDTCKMNGTVAAVVAPKSKACNRKSRSTLQRRQVTRVNGGSGGHLQRLRSSSIAALMAPFPCRFCTGRFTTKEALELHQWAHLDLLKQEEEEEEEKSGDEEEDEEKGMVISDDLITNGLNMQVSTLDEPKVTTTTNGHHFQLSHCDYYYHDFNDYKAVDDDPELDGQTGCIRLKEPVFVTPFFAADSEQEEAADGDGGHHRNGLTNGYHHEEEEEEDEEDDYSEPENSQQPVDNLKPAAAPPLPALLPPPPTRPSAKRQRALQKKTSRYMSKKLEKASQQVQVLTGNQLPTGVGKYLIVSLACPLVTATASTASTSCVGQSFPDKAALDEHLQVVHSLLPYRCVFANCDANFASSDDLTSHTSSAHASGPYICAQCTDGASNSSNSSSSTSTSNSQPSYELLAKHHLNYHQTGVFRCPVEGCTAPAAPNRLLAVRHYHQIHLPYACNWKHCKRTFAYAPELAEHTAGHAAPRPFSCPHPGCGKTFLTKAHLAEHERIHTGIKPYLCTYPACDYAAKTRNSVLVHVRSKHLGMTRMSGSERDAAERLHDPQQYVAVRRELL